VGFYYAHGNLSAGYATSLAYRVPDLRRGHLYLRTRLSRHRSITSMENSGTAGMPWDCSVYHPSFDLLQLASCTRQSF